MQDELSAFTHEVTGGTTKPFGFMKLTPGPGTGGHCIPNLDKSELKI